MRSSAQLLNLGTTLTQNLTSSNQALLVTLMSDQHRYLIQKYFDNERSFQTTTVGGQSDVGLTASLAADATTATLDSAWTYPTGQQLVNFSNGDQRLVLFTNGSTSISWVGGLSDTADDEIDTVGQQRYLIPANVSKVKNDTISVGQLRYVPAPVMTRKEWDMLNFLPYTSDIVNYFYIYNGAVEFFPIPSTTGNIITFNYKARVPDFTTAFLFSTADGAAYSAGATAFDYQKGSLASLAAGSTAVTGSSTAWNTTGGFPLGVDVTYFNLFLVANQPKGEGIWYPISSFTSDTALTLATPISSAASATTSSNGYSIAQLPILSEDFQDMILYGALKVYFSSIVKDADQFKQFSTLYEEKRLLLEDYAGTKQVNVDLGQAPTLNNPNLFLYGNGS